MNSKEAGDISLLVMGLVERLNELEAMRQSGQISDSEYAMLVASTTKKFSEEAQVINPSLNEPVSNTSQNIVKSKSASVNSKFVGIGVALALGIAFLLFVQRDSNNRSGDSQTQVSVILAGDLNADRENSARACRDEGTLSYNQIVLTTIRTGLDADSSASGVVDYEKAGSLKGAKSWIELEMEWLKKSLEIVKQIDRPELSIETTATIRELNQLIDLQLFLLDANAFTEFNQITPQYHVVLNRFFNSDTLDSALHKICVS